MALPKANTGPARDVVQLGLKQNLAQFSLLVGVNALVGGMIHRRGDLVRHRADAAMASTSPEVNRRAAEA